MRYEINADFSRLTIIVEPDTQQFLRNRMKEPGFHSDSFMLEVFEWLIANSELEWIEPSVTGDLTSAPMLAILGEEQQDAGDLYFVGFWDGKTHRLPVLHRWAFMDYQVRSVQQDLAEKGRAVFAGD